ncbi:MAG TPA: hypothetical protein VFY48_11700 [Solirubrobacterales bacterium]|nr:hypothetical protein [Solirubrobacterales bacterium]
MSAQDSLEARLREAEVTNVEAKARLASARADSVLREAAQVEVRSREIAVRIRREEAETGAIAFARLRDQVILIVFLLTVILVLALALLDLPLLKELGATGSLAFILGMAGGRFGRRP